MAARRLFSDATFKFIGAVEDEWQLYSDNASDYTIGGPIGFGASSIVYQAEYHPSSGGGSIPCALKVLDLDSLPMRSLRLLRKETQLMSLSKHPNVLRVRGTWIDGSKLYIALRLMRSGSVADVMHYGWPGGVDEEVAKCILKQALDGLNYLHINGFIHRDVKAANLLVDDDGTVLLGDLGVATALNDEDSTSPKSAGMPGSASDVVSPRSTAPLITSGIGKRKSFVGTPCWMAPEVISQRHYDSKADIWSLGITALELAQGRAPRSRDPPHTVLMKTIQDEPPSLDREGGQFKYSKAFKEIIQSCLTKDPTRRPTAEGLLQTVFFKSAKKKGHLVGALLNGLPPLEHRKERRRIPSAVSYTSMESWDFSQGGVTSSSASSTSKRSLDDGVFEMDETKETTRSSEKEKTVTFISSLSPSLDTRTEASPLRESTDEALSTPSTSLLSSNLHHSIHTASSHSVTLVPSHRVIPSSPSPPVKGISLSSSPGLWRKLRSIGSKTSMDQEEHHDKLEAKRSSTTPAGRKGDSLAYS